MYKLADMFWHGYGCKKSTRTARTLYDLVYTDSLRHFLKGEEANFADTVLRMGNVYTKGIQELVDVENAYFFYLQADYAARLRVEESDFFGYASVVRNIQELLESVRKLLPEGYQKDYVDFNIPYLFKQMSNDNYKCELVRIVNPEGNTELTARRLPTRSVPEPEAILITIPPLSYCVRSHEASFIMDDSGEAWFKDLANHVRFDYCGWNPEEDRFEFYYDDEIVAWTRSENYRFCGVDRP